MVQLVPHLWFDDRAREAVAFYTELFPDSGVDSEMVLHETPSGDARMLTFHVWGQEFQAIDGGPAFPLNPSISFFVNIDPSRVENAEAEVDRIHAALSEGGTERMELGEYPFSRRYGWVDDRFGVSWQVMLTDPQGEERPAIVPSLAFGDHAAGGAAAAREFYLEVFDDARAGTAARFADMELPAGAPPVNPEGLAYSDLRIAGAWVAMMDAPGFPDTFNEAVSLILRCDDQAEADRYWDALSAVPEAEQCGWVKDRFGVSWQVLPGGMEAFFSGGTPEQAERVTKAMLQMKRIDVAGLRAAFEG